MVFTTKKGEYAKEKINIALDDTILTKDMPTTAGSKMLGGYMSLFNAEVVDKLISKGYNIVGKTDVGEFSFDLIGESSVNGANAQNGVLTSAFASAILSNDADAVINLDVNGTCRRAVAISDLVSVKPTYGVVSRYGTIPVACSGETVSVSAKNVDTAYAVLKDIAGHDDKDGTSLYADTIEGVFANDYKAKKVAVINSLALNIDDKVKAKLDETIKSLENNGVVVEKIDEDILTKANIAWNVLMSAELCNNVSRYDGVKYGYRTQNFTNIDELYTNTRTEAFGDLLKTTILYGSEALSTENYFKVYDKALRIRRVIKEKLDEIFAQFDAVIIPAVSTLEYDIDTVKNDKYLCFKENVFTAISSITGLPTVTVNAMQFVGKFFSEKMLCDLAKNCEKGDR